MSKPLLDYQVKIIKAGGIRDVKEHKRTYTVFLEKEQRVACLFMHFSPHVRDAEFTCFGLSYVFKGKDRVAGVVLVDVGKCKDIAIGEYFTSYSELDAEYSSLLSR
jgi:hypothetical protein